MESSYLSEPWIWGVPLRWVGHGWTKVCPKRISSFWAWSHWARLYNWREGSRCLKLPWWFLRAHPCPLHGPQEGRRTMCAHVSPGTFNWWIYLCYDCLLVSTRYQKHKKTLFFIYLIYIFEQDFLMALFWWEPSSTMRAVIILENICYHM